MSETTAAPPRSSVSRYAWYALFVLVLVYIVNFIDRQILSILVADISVEVDRRIVFARHCTEWHRVERLCTHITDQPWDEHTHDLRD